MKREHNRERLAEGLQGLIEGKHTLREVSEWTGYTRQHLCALKGRYKKEGEACLVNGHRGKRGPRAIPQEEKDRIVAIYRRDFTIGGEGANFSYFHRELAASHGIRRSYRAVHNLLSAAGIQSPERRRAGRKRAHRPRPRKGREGELLQMDASPYGWLKWADGGARHALHGAIDDATGKIAGLHLCKSECALGYFAVLEQAIGGHGLPSCVYTDRSAVFCGPKGGAALREGRTQWQRAMGELGIGQSLASSPQAKGRIERLWRTLQGRLPFALKMAGAGTVEEANRFLRDSFIPAFNAEFAVEAQGPPAWREPPEGWEAALCMRFPRKADGAGVVSFMGRKLLVRAGCARREVVICAYGEGIRALYKGRLHDVELVEDAGRRGRGPEALRALAAKALAAGKGEP